MNRSLSGRDVLVWLAGFFGIIIAVNIWFVMASLRTFSGEDEQKPYLQGVAYNQTLARRAEQSALGWRATIATSRLESGAVRISVILNRPDGTPESGLTLTGELHHPADEGLDRTLHLEEKARGLYQAELAGIHRGEWDVIVATAANLPPFEARRRLWVP